MANNIVYFFNNKLVNKIFYKLVRSKFSKFFIPLYKKIYKIDESIIVDDNFDSLQSFFVRHIDLEKRPIGDGKYVSPCDGFISAAGKLTDDTTFKVKGKIVDVKTLTDEDRRFQYFQVIYLSPSDYHRFHAIDCNQFYEKKELGTISIPVNDLGFEMGNPFLENHRIILKSKDYYYIPIGATNVNSIDILKTDFNKGDEIGKFNFGSTIVILYNKIPGESKLGKIKVRENLFS